MAVMSDQMPVQEVVTLVKEWFINSVFSLMLENLHVEANSEKH